jgi:hypothetical protein
MIPLPSAGAGGTESFTKFGLLAERTPEGISCNLRIIGGLGGITVEPQWGTRCTSAYLLALTIVRHLTELPSEAEAPMAQHVTEHFKRLPRATHMLDDGTTVTPWQTRLAHRLAQEHIYSAPDPHSLSLPVDRLLEALAKYVRETWPDENRG